MEEPGKKAGKAFTLSDACMVAGACVVAAGIGFIYWPAGVIAAGILLVAAGFVVFD